MIFFSHNLQFIAYKLSTEIFIILDLKIKIEKGILCSINFYFSTSINISHAKNNKNNNKKNTQNLVYTHMVQRSLTLGLLSPAILLTEFLLSLRNHQSKMFRGFFKT